MEYCFKMTTELMADNQVLFSPLFIKKQKQKNIRIGIYEAIMVTFLLWLSTNMQTTWLLCYLVWRL